MHNFSSRLRRLMEEHNLTPQQVALVAGVSRSAVVNWLNGSSPRSRALFRLAMHFGLSMDWFMGGDERSEHPAKESASAPPLDVPVNKVESGFGFYDFMVRILREYEKRGLPDVIHSDKNVDEMMPSLSSLRARLKAATAERGSKTKLAAWLGVPPSSVSAWISGDKDPGGETTLKLLSWVQERERANQNKKA